MMGVTEGESFQVYLSKLFVTVVKVGEIVAWWALCRFKNNINITFAHYYLYKHLTTT